MRLPPKDKRLNTWEWPAYLFDLYRVFPRAMTLAATWYVAKVGYWYMFILTPVERTTEVSAFVGVVSVAWGKLMDWYMQRGNDWSKRLLINGGESYGTNSGSSMAGS